MEQKYDGEEQYISHFLYNLPAFKDHRYICVDGKPVFVIWNPRDHSDEIKSMISIWQRLAKEHGLLGIHFVARQYGDDSLDWLHSLGFNAVYQERTLFAFNKGNVKTLKSRVIGFCSRHFGIQLALNKVDFNKVFKLLVSDEAKRTDVYPSLLAGYDRSPRAGKAAQIFFNFTPDSWRKHIDDVFKYIRNKDTEENIVMLKSWNEWGESNYVEPDLKYGSALLDVLHDEMEKAFH